MKIEIHPQLLKGFPQGIFLAGIGEEVQTLLIAFQSGFLRKEQADQLYLVNLHTNLRYVRRIADRGFVLLFSIIQISTRIIHEHDLRNPW